MKEKIGDEVIITCGVTSHAGERGKIVRIDRSISTGVFIRFADGSEEAHDSLEWGCCYELIPREFMNEED